MIRWGILGAGNIAHRFAASLQHQPDSVLTAVSCRSLEKAGSFAAAYSAERFYAGHDPLLEDTGIDAIYLALPHGLHREWAVKALRGGKAVLCEKPAALSAGEMLDIARTARETGVLFMEAMKQRFVPLYRELKNRVADGEIGRLTRLETSWCAAMSFEEMEGTYLTDPEQGGVLLDCGIYGAGWLEDFLPGETPALSDVAANIREGIDYYVDAALRFGGAEARLECGFDRTKPRQAILWGTAGHIVVDEQHRPQTMTVFRDGQPREDITIPYEVDDFYSEIDHFAACLKQGKAESDIMPLAASIRCAGILDTIRAGLRTQQPDP